MGSQIETMIRSTVTKAVETVATFNRKRMPQPDAPHPFLSGIHRPMTEEVTLTELEVTGTIPAALDGRYLRIGPNPVDADPASYHWFVGDGMVHGLRIAQGQALWYRNRWIRSNAVAEAIGVAPAPGPRHVFGQCEHQCRRYCWPHLRFGRGGQLSRRTVGDAGRAGL